MAVLSMIFVLGQSLFWSLAAADASNLNPKGDGCVDPSGYLQCYEDNVNQLTTCMNDAKKTCDDYEYSTCVLACGNAQLAANIGCWLTSCWNEVQIKPFLSSQFILTLFELGLFLCIPRNSLAISHRCRPHARIPNSVLPCAG